MLRIAKRSVLFFVSLIFFGFLTACEHTTQPEAVEKSEDAAFVPLLNYLQMADIDWQNKKGVFNLHWGRFDFAEEASTELLESAWAVFFKNTNQPAASSQGIDIGDIIIESNERQIKLRKFANPDNGIFYRFGASGNSYSHDSIPFKANEAYQYMVSGSKSFDGFHIVLPTPPALVKITNPAKNGNINLNQDVTIFWQGGMKDEKVLVIVTPVILFGPGKSLTDEQWKKVPSPFAKTLTQNAGEYKLSSAELQNLISHFRDLIALAVEKRLAFYVSQFSTYEMEIDKQPLLFVTENSDRVELSFQ
jgi:hypothetical protein